MGALEPRMRIVRLSLSIPEASPLVLTWRSRAAVGVAARAFALLVIALPSYAQTVSPQGADATRNVDARTMSCADLKSRVRDSGPLVVSSGPEGGDIFHPRVPQCQFWQRPQYSFLRAKDGWCGVGYVCAAKFQG
jgi:hypothetical protein